MRAFSPEWTSSTRGTGTAWISTSGGTSALDGSQAAITGRPLRSTGQKPFAQQSMGTAQRQWVPEASRAASPTKAGAEAACRSARTRSEAESRAPRTTEV
jgi:hypothetical protein